MLKAAQNRTIACRLVLIIIAPTAARRFTSNLLPPFSEALFRDVTKTNVSLSDVLQYTRNFEERPLRDSGTSCSERRLFIADKSEEKKNCVLISLWPSTGE